MPLRIADADGSVLIVVDLQPTFLSAIWDKEAVVRRSEFLTRVARLLDVPVLATEQNPERMGGTDESVLRHLGQGAIAKKRFSCVGCEAFDSELARLGRSEAIIVGIEAHICVAQTALDLLAAGYVVRVCEDAVGARTRHMNEIGLDRVRHAGADVTHTESVAYEWLRSSDHPRFRDALALVKAAY